MSDLSLLLLRLTDLLLVPDVFALLLLVLWTLLQAGGVVGEALDRRRWVSRLRAAVEGQEVDPSELSGLPRRAFERRGTRPEKVVHDLDLEAERRLARLLVGARLGPILGLAGTLIPLGPALVSLSQGDLAALSERLVVAFSTTVLGLFAGGVCYVLLQVRRQWYEQDLSDVEHLLVVAPSAAGRATYGREER